ncbi:hypothetical protein [Alicyclobacillus fodiniaquatilis]|uniref:Uncharacterized protein n=1 Tax=Alicyclobacillus fodiniaquatilis TaxID=1661150 RepID=A0ABW4JKG3_9BACL
MGNSKTYNYPKANRRSTSSQTGDSSRVEEVKAHAHQPPTFQANAPSKGK